jgi:hypothetical protein
MSQDNADPYDRDAESLEQGRTSARQPTEEQAGTGGVGEMAEQRQPGARDQADAGTGAAYDLTPGDTEREPQSESGI